jgi:hypothetical protein
MFRDSKISFSLRYAETTVSRPSKTRATRDASEWKGEGKVVWYVQLASFTLDYISNEVEDTSKLYGAWFLSSERQILRGMISNGGTAGFRECNEP